MSRWGTGRKSRLVTCVHWPWSRQRKIVHCVDQVWGSWWGGLGGRVPLAERRGGTVVLCRMGHRNENPKECTGIHAGGDLSPTELLSVNDKIKLLLVTGGAFQTQESLFSSYAVDFLKNKPNFRSLHS